MQRFAFLFFLFTSAFGFGQNTFMKTLGTVNSDYGTACILTEDLGSLLLTGGGATTGGVQFGMAKTSYDGTLEWQKVFQYGAFSLAYDVVSTNDGYCVLGSKGGSFNSQDLFLMQTDPSGNELWKFHYELSLNDKPVQLIKCNNGDLLSISISNYNSSGYPYAQMVRYDAQGNVLWSRTYSGFNGISPRAVVELSDGSIAFVSKVRIPNQPYPEHSIVVKTDATGNVLWSKVFFSDYLEEPHDMVVNENDELFVVGNAYLVQNEFDGFLMKLDAIGNIVYDVFYEAGTFQGEIFRRVALDNKGSVLIAGDVGGFNERNVLLLKVKESNGAVEWSYQYPLSPQFTNYAADLYLSFNDGIVFTGDVRPQNYYRDAALFRADKNGQIGCFTESINFTTSSTVFSSSDEVITGFEFSVTSQTPFSFAFPNDPITEKVVCENPGPLAFIDWQIVDNCPAICFDFTSENISDATSWKWEFEGASPSNSTEENPKNVCYNSPGNYKVSLTVSNAEGSATFDEWISVPATNCPLGEIPNVFSPNGDHANDFFAFEGLSGDFNFQILNRWGVVVFETSQPNNFWDGTNKNGTPVSEGVYFYKLVKNDQEKHGFIHLIR